jgi:type I restriction enzyme M protein
MRPAIDGGSRFGIVLNGSPLFTGGAGSGESEIRRYVLENDLLEAIVALPTDMFYNTGISTYVWILSNRKTAPRKGKVQMIDASSFWRKMRKSLGSKRKEMSEEQTADVTRLFGSFVEAQLATLFDAGGKAVDRAIVEVGEQSPQAPEGGKVTRWAKGRAARPWSSLRGVERKSATGAAGVTESPDPANGCR